MKTINFLFGLIVGCGLVYLTWSFGHWSLNPKSWEPISRWFSIPFMFLMSVGFGKSFNEKK